MGSERSRIHLAIRDRFRDGSFWFAASSFLPPAAGILLGTINLRILGLQDYALLSLAGYYYAMALGYSDFGSQSHLLAVFAKRSPGREQDFGNVLALKVLIFAGFLAALGCFAWLRPRTDDLYALLGLSLLALPMPSMYMEWYLNARRDHAALFKARILMLSAQMSLTLAWLASGSDSARFAPLIGVAAAGVSSFYLARILGLENIRRGLSALGRASWTGMGELAARLAPVMATQIVTPFFLAYSLPWYAMTTSDPHRIGPFSIAYRMVMGLLAVVGSFVFYSMPKSVKAGSGPSLIRTTFLAGAATIALWAAGMPILWFYYRASGTDFGLLPSTVGSFSVLMLGIFFNAARIPLVSRCLVSGSYRTYFLVHAGACAPTLILSMAAGDKFPSSWVPWFAVLPDLLATIGFAVSGRTFMGRGNMEARIQ